MRINNKRGISLIVLVITIIVMIILAAAIILSLNNSGIIGKANKAKQDSDTANLKEYVNVLQAEYDLMTESERAGNTIAAYVNENLEKKGYTNALLMEDGTLYTNLQANSKAALKAGIKIGDTVTGYTLDTSKSSYTTSGKENTAKLKSGSTDSYEEVGEQRQTINQTAFTEWKFAGIGEKGELVIVPALVSGANTMILSGKAGYLYGVSELNTVCLNLYSVNNVGTAKSIDIYDISRMLNYTGTKGTYYDAEYNTITTPKAKKISEFGTLTYTSTPDESPIGNYYSDYYYIVRESDDISATDTMKSFIFTSCKYWLSSTCQCVTLKYGAVGFRMYFSSTSGVYASDMFNSNNLVYSCEYAIRPAVSLNSNVILTKQSDSSWSI